MPTTAGSFGLQCNETPKTSSYTVLAADNGTLFTNTGAVGAVTFTLPLLAAGFCFKFLVTADQSVTIASNEGTNMQVYNNTGASNVAFSTVGQRLGGVLLVYTNAAASKWYVENPSKCPTTTS